jgi:predicted dinucleotide-binding enzyme
LRVPRTGEGIAVTAAKKHTVEEEVVFLAVRTQKSMKRQLQQIALDEKLIVQKIVRIATKGELNRRDPKSRQANER